MPEVVPFGEGACPDFDGAVSFASLILESGPAINVWSGAATVCGKSAAQATLEILGDQPVVIGRQEGGQIEYLDPRFRPTQMVPDTEQVVQHGAERDRLVSRGHFMLRARRGGLVLVNGVPRRGGGLRPPLNGTIMLCPHYRYMSPGEEYLIEPGTTARIRLPNGTVISIQAN
jgi:hypothetical protein